VLLIADYTALAAGLLQWWKVMYKYSTTAEGKRRRAH
jgi:hypothetical protein